MLESMRRDADRAELITAKEYWPYPDMGEMLFSEE